MAIKSGRLGNILYDALGVTPVALAAVNAWKLDLKTGKLKVTCFQDLNEQYVPGLKDISGSGAGLWDSAALEIFDAADADTPGMLELMPNSSEATFFWKGLAYMDASIDCKVDAAPTTAFTFMAAGDWTREPVVP
jgi:hypothetical protein